MSNIPIEVILTPTQYRYYQSYFRDGKTMTDISIENDVNISTVCRVLKNARKRILEYCGGSENGKQANTGTKNI